MRRKALRPEEREILVINWFQIRLQHDNDDWASMHEIARGQGLSPSSKLTKLLLWMVERDTLESTVLQRSGRWQGRGYRLKRGTFQRVPQKTIKLNFHKGKERQLELL